MSKKIVILCFDDAQILDITGPAQVFASVNEAYNTPEYDIVLASPAGASTRTTSGISLATVPYEEIGGPVHTLMVSGGNGTRATCEDQKVLTWLKHMADGAERVASVCTGTFLLAAAGVLAGRRAATHWRSTRALARLYPAVDVDAEALYVEDGRFWTSAGVTAGIDMSLAIIERDHGRPLAMGIARRLVVYARRPGYQSQFSALLEGQSKGTGLVAKAAEWMASHMNGAITVADIADAAGMSERSFHRKFVAEMGVTPARYLERLRLDSARALLEQPDIPVKTVAASSGFGSSGRLIQVFEKRFGLTPGAYRKLHGTSAA
ncbi:GlxA family transcriptional regulator [Kordiimonas aestuarii]|uniref:GlxA family transcriptional regulator n=1 Tax=Kordiimonas aestuarii TaxID=1005925 RepID=UPI0021D36C29|nr:GlxA family transcriptional regulator [Kordiimonas aestuarii]